MSNELHCYEYVARPFEPVRGALVDDAVRLFGPATDHAAERARVLVDNLRVKVAGLEVGKQVAIHVVRIEQYFEPPGHVASEGLRLELEWKAETNSALFPSMHATLLVYPLSPTETQLDLQGTYVPPGGVLGAAADRLVGHHVARATVHRFLEEVAARLAA